MKNFICYDRINLRNLLKMRDALAILKDICPLEYIENYVRVRDEIDARLEWAKGPMVMIP